MIIMMTDTVLRNKGMKILVEYLGKVEAERFISLVLREPFDYTTWQEDLFQDLSVRELSSYAMHLREKENT